MFFFFNIWVTAANTSPPYPDDDREQRPTPGGQVDIRVQQVFVQVRMRQQRQLGEHGGHLQVHVVGLEGREGTALKINKPSS